jgi:hypothetical protein
VDDVVPSGPVYATILQVTVEGYPGAAGAELPLIASQFHPSTHAPANVVTNSAELNLEIYVRKRVDGYGLLGVMWSNSTQNWANSHAVPFQPVELSVAVDGRDTIKLNKPSGIGFPPYTGPNGGGYFLAVITEQPITSYPYSVGGGVPGWLGLTG